MIRAIKIMVIALLALSQAAQSTETKCIKSGEIWADKIRYVEMHLRVAVLQCGSYEHSSLAQLYTDFVLGNRPFLARSQQPLQSYLTRTGRGPMASYLGEMADKISRASATAGQFCSRSIQAAQLAEKATNPLALLPLMPVRYERPAQKCKNTDYARP